MKKSHLNFTKRVSLTKYELLISLYNIIPGHINKGELQLFSNPYNLVAIFHFSKWHLNGRLCCLLPINISWRNFVQHFQKKPSAHVIPFSKQLEEKTSKEKKFDEWDLNTCPFLTSSKTLLTQVAIPRLLIHNLKALSSLDTKTSSVIISAKDIFLLSTDKPFLQIKINNQVINQRKQVILGTQLHKLIQTTPACFTNAYIGFSSFSFNIF